MPQRVATGIERTCLQCGKIFFVSLAYLRRKENHGRFCSGSCRTIYNNKHGITGKKREYVFLTCPICYKLFRITKARFKRENTKFCSKKCEGKARSIFQLRQGNPHWSGNTPEVQCENCGKLFLATLRESSRRQKFCSWACYLANTKRINLFAKELLTRLRKDPDFIHKMVVGQNRKPTMPEKKLTEILNKHFPNEWRYTGDGCFSIEGYWPDFTNCNGKKEVIELFGDYWHSSEVIGDDWRNSELGKIMAYNSFGYRCLVIWQHELKEFSERAIAEKIYKFQKEGRHA